jgi:hypothetical protein
MKEVNPKQQFVEACAAIEFFHRKSGNAITRVRGPIIATAQGVRNVHIYVTSDPIWKERIDALIAEVINQEEAKPQ